MKTAIDSNILSALWSGESSAPRVAEQLHRAREQGAAVVCAPVYAELIAHPLASDGFVDKFLADTGIRIDFVLREEVWRTAADGFAAYAKHRRGSGGTSPKRLLSDFVIAAHALVQADCLLTLDPTRYRQDFPKLRLL